MFFGSFEVLSRVALSKGETEVFAGKLVEVCNPFCRRGCLPSERIEVCDIGLHVGLTGAVFEAKGMFKGHGIAGNKLQGPELLDQKFTRVLASTLVISMNPDDTAKSLRCCGQCAPISATLSITFIGSRRSKRKAQTDNETENGKQHGVDTQIMDLFGDDGNSCCPTGHEQERKDKRRHDRAV
ncbi:hypothetical protein HG530_013087 [Fusarium avenaceum]|nr:hypothetical protein HG530_013087 [Fusarium avenaceum]